MGMKTMTTICLKIAVMSISMVVPMSMRTYKGVAMEPNVRPITVIFTAAARLPLANPVQEMVMPEVGTSPASSRPKAM